MTAQVLDLAAAREERSPHISGEATCLGCRHKWVQVMPTNGEAGIEWIECPACMRNLGRFINKFTFPSSEDGGGYWVCNCGNELLRLYANGHVMCPNCGAIKDAATL